MNIMPEKRKNILLRTFVYVIDNFDTILSIVLAIVAALISTFGGKMEIAIAATAGVLTLISVSLIRDRQARDKLLNQVTNIDHDIRNLTAHPSADLFFSRKTSEQEIILSAENELLLVQETGRLIAETCRRELVNFLKKGGRIRWINVLDNHHLSDLMAFRNANLTPSLMLGRMKNGIEMIEVLTNDAFTYAANLEVRFLPYPIDITAIFNDPSHLDKRKKGAIIRLQGFKVTFDDKLDFKVNAENSKDVYNLFIQQAENMWMISTKCLFLTGKPGIGKSTLLTKAVARIKQDQDIKISGFLTHDIRNADGERVGFETETIDKKKKGELAVKQSNGSYKLNHITIDEIVIPEILNGLENSDIIVIDEIGPIQLQNPDFQKSINLLLSKRDVSILGIVALEGHSYLSKIYNHYRTGLINVSESNRESLVERLVSEFSLRKVL